MNQGEIRMFRPFSARYVLTATLTLGAVSPALTEAAAPDSTLFTTYTVATDLKSAHYLVCGSTVQDEGCYSSGSLGPFAHIGSMLEGQPVVSGNTVTRKLYVLDVASGTSANGVSLFVYTKTDVVSDSYDQVTVTLDQTVALPLVGGSTVTASMAGNDSYLFVGTNQSTQAARIAKDQLVVTTTGSFSPPIPFASATADTYGYVTVTFGAPGGQDSGFVVYGPTGALQEDGGGAQFSLNSANGVAPAPLPF
jgi:hypothetical protein